MDVMNLGLQDWVTCPFDPVHRMKYSRFYNHFVECRKKHPDDRRRQCPYNFSEMIEPENWDKHVIECPYRSLYINAGQFTQLPEYDAPCHFDIIDEPQEPLRQNSTVPNQFDDSDEEFDSVSMADQSAFNSYFPQRKMPRYETPENPVSVDSGSSTSTEKRGFGRGAWIRQMMEQRNSAPKVGSQRSVSSEESLRSCDDSSSFFSNKEDLEKFKQTYRDDPQRIARDYGRGRGAIFRTLLHD